MFVKEILRIFAPFQTSVPNFALVTVGLFLFEPSSGVGQYPESSSCLT